MFSKLVFRLLLFFALKINNEITNADEYRVEKMYKIINLPGWRSMQNVKIIVDNNIITVDDIVAIFEEIVIVSEEKFEIILSQLSVVLTCKYASQIRELILLVQRITRKCRAKWQKGKLNNLVNCVDIVIKHMQHNVAIVVLVMLNDLIHINQLLPQNTNYRYLYDAFLPIILYSNEAHSELNVLNKGESQTINELDYIDRLLFAVDNKTQTFIIGRCWPLPYSLRQSFTNRSFKEKILINHVSYSIVDGCKQFLNDKIKIMPDNERQTPASFNITQSINLVLENYLPTEKPIRLRWLEQMYDVPTFVEKINSREGTASQAVFQLLMLRPVTCMLYTKTSNAILSFIKVIEQSKIVESCPEIFLKTLKQHWIKLCLSDLTAVGEACLAIKEVNNTKICQREFEKSLRKKWLNLHSINSKAIEAACAITVKNSKELSTQKNYSNGGKKCFIFNLCSSENKTAISSKPTENKNLRENNFFNSLKGILLKLRAISLPADVTVTLNIVDYMLDTINERPCWDGIDKDIIELLKTQIKVGSVECDDVTATNRFPEVHLKSLDKFVGDLIKIRKPIELIGHSYSLLWNATDIDPIPEPNENTNDLATAEVCDVTIKLIEVLELNRELLHICTNITTANLRTKCFKHIQDIGVLFSSKIEWISIRLFSQTLLAPKIENVSIQNALVLTLLYLNNVGRQTEFEQNYLERLCEQYDPSSVPVEQLKALNGFISNQLENYVINNCNISNHQHAKLHDLRTNAIQGYRSNIIEMCNETLYEMKVNFGLKIEDCIFNLSTATHEVIVNNTKDENSPLICIDQFEILWNDNLLDIKSIRNKVLADINPTSFAKYQTLVLNIISSLLFGYLLNILQVIASDNNNLHLHEIALLNSKIDVFANTVFPVSKIDSPSYIINIFKWSLRPSLISKEKSNIVKEMIEKTVMSYGIELTKYYEILKRNDILLDANEINIPEMVINPLINFVDDTLKPFNEHFYCVAKYMTVRL